MPDRTSRRQRILTVIAERVAVVQQVNGYQTDAGAMVVLGETPQLGPDDPDTAIAILVGDEQARWNRAHVLVRLPIEVQAVVKDSSPSAWWVVEALVADIKRAVERPDRELAITLNGGEVKLLSPTPGLTREVTRTVPRETGMTTVGAGVTYVAEFGEVWGDP